MNIETATERMLRATVAQKLGKNEDISGRFGLQGISNLPPAIVRVRKVPIFGFPAIQIYTRTGQQTIIVPDNGPVMGKNSTHLNPEFLSDSSLAKINFMLHLTQFPPTNNPERQ